MNRLVMAGLACERSGVLQVVGLSGFVIFGGPCSTCVRFGSRLGCCMDAGQAAVRALDRWRCRGILRSTLRSDTVVPVQQSIVQSNSQAKLYIRCQSILSANIKSRM